MAKAAIDRREVVSQAFLQHGPISLQALAGLSCLSGGIALVRGSPLSLVLTSFVGALVLSYAAPLAGRGSGRRAQLLVSAGISFLILRSLAGKAVFADDANTGLIGCLIVATGAVTLSRILLAAVAVIGVFGVFLFSVVGTQPPPPIYLTAFLLLSPFASVLLWRARLLSAVRIYRTQEQVRVVEGSFERNERRWEALLDNCPDGILLLSTGEMVVYASPGAARMFGYQPAQMVGDGVLKSFHPDDLHPAKAALSALGSGTLTRWSGEFRCHHADGHWVWVEATACARFDDPAIDAIIVSFRDVSDRKHAELARAASEDRMRQSEKMEAIGRLAGGVAHDLNNQLFVINGYAELLAPQLRDRPELRQRVEEILEAGLHSQDLTRQLLAFGRKQILSPRVLDTHREITRTLKTLRYLIGEDVLLRYEGDSNVGSIRVDPTQFQQVIINLATNARDAMPAGGTLTVRASAVTFDEAQARRHALPPGDYVSLALSDTGCGIDEETRGRIFEPFFTTKGPNHGTGLGLATVHGIIGQSGGSIDVESVPGSGSTFTIRLPRVDEGAHNQPSAPTEAPRLGSGRTVLVVEDDLRVCKLVSTVLASAGYCVFEASSGQDALSLLAGDDPVHLLLTDVVMPEISGPELAKRARKIRPELKVLYMSGYTDDEVIRRGILTRRIELLVKPVSATVLLERVHALVH